MLKLQKINKRLGVFTLNDISLDVSVGEYFILLGISGAGKTVLLELIAGLQRPDSGKIFLNDKDITYSKVQERGLGLVYQDLALFPHMTVRSNIGYGLRTNRQTKRSIVGQVASDLGITALLDRYPYNLSGGESHLVALARALAIKPSFMLLDEPLATLDAQARAEMRALLRSVNRAGISILHVTHDYEEALALGSRVAILENGVINQIGSPEEILSSPETEFTARFVGIRNIYYGTLAFSSDNKDNLAKFRINKNICFNVLAERNVNKGIMLLRSEDVVIYIDHPQSSSIRNLFSGQIIDCEPSRMGKQVLIDIGVPIWSSISNQAWNDLQLQHGKNVWVGFKASSLRIVPN